MLEENRPEKSLRKLLAAAGRVETPPVERTAGAAREVRKALEAVGGSGSPAGSALWYVAGEQLSVREWALRRGWAGKRVERNEAKSILVAALGVLACHYGFERSDGSNRHKH